MVDPGPTCDLFEQQSCREIAHCPHRLANGAQRGIGERHQRRVVEAKHRQVTGYMQPLVVSRTNRPQRHHIACCDDRGCTFGDQAAGGDVAALDGEDRLRYERRLMQPVSPDGVTVSVQLADTERLHLFEIATGEVIN